MTRPNAEPTPCAEPTTKVMEALKELQLCAIREQKPRTMALAQDAIDQVDALEAENKRLHAAYRAAERARS